MRKKNINTSKINPILRQKIEIKQETKVVKNEKKKQNLLSAKKQPQLLQDESSDWDHDDEYDYSQEKDQELYEEDDEEEIDYNDDCQDDKKQSGKCQSKQRRNQNSLSVLTQKFIKLIQDQPNQSIDLNFAVQKLKVSKRRIYDITNALQGVNLVQKTKKNIIKWKGHQKFKNKNYANQKNLKFQIQKYTKQILEQLESQQPLDREIQKQYQQIRQLEFTADNIRRGYIDFDFIKSVTKKNQQKYCSQDQKMVFVSAPKGTHLKLIQKGDGAHKLTATNDQSKLPYLTSAIKMFIVDKQQNKLFQYLNKQFREINEDGEFFQFGTIKLQLGRIASKYD